jgi:hypothetical protein
MFKLEGKGKKVSQDFFERESEVSHDLLIII